MKAIQVDYECNNWYYIIINQISILFERFYALFLIIGKLISYLFASIHKGLIINEKFI